MYSDTMNQGCLISDLLSDLFPSQKPNFELYMYVQETKRTTMSLLNWFPRVEIPKDKLKSRLN